MAPKKAARAKPLRSATGSSLGECPLCRRSFALALLSNHAARCTGPIAAPPAKRARAAEASPAPAAFPPPAAATQPSALSALRWKPDCEVAQRYGSHTGRGGSRDVSAGAAPGVVHRTCGLQGHLVVEDFLSEAEEEELIQHVEAPSPSWATQRHNGLHMGKQWGVRNLYGQGIVLPPLASAPFPDWLAPFVERIRAQLPALSRFAPNEVNAIWYDRARGDWLRPHVDDRRTSGDIIVNLSLAGACVMCYGRMDGGGEPMRVRLPRRCLQVQSFAARYEYSHGIANADLEEPKRLSLTMRERALRPAGFG